MASPAEACIESVVMLTLQAKDAEKLRDVLARPTDAAVDAVLETGPDAYAAWVKGIGKELKLKGKNMWMPFRLCLTGALQGAELSPLMAALALENNDVVDRKLYVPVSERVEILRKVRNSQG